MFPFFGKLYCVSLSRAIFLLCILGPMACLSAFAEKTARFLYVQNCSEHPVNKIFVEIAKEKDEWEKSGRHWVHLPLGANEAACFDTADMYGDVPEGAHVRLRLEMAPPPADLYPVTVSEMEATDRTEVNCPSVSVTKHEEGAAAIYKYIPFRVASDRSFYSEGCHALAYVNWHPEEGCRGQGTRLQKIQCD